MEILFVLLAGFVLAGAFGWEVARIVRQARWIAEWEDEMGEIAVSVALSDETFEWARQKAAEKGEGLRDFLGGVIEEAKRKEGKCFREAES